MKIYKEQNRFRDGVFFGLLLLGVIASVAGFIRTLTSTQPSLSILIAYGVVAIILMGLGYILFQLRTKLSINEERIKYRLYPLYTHSRRIPWEDVAYCGVIRAPKYGSWFGNGIHFHGVKWCSLVGRNGLQVIEKDGTQHFIGCRDTENLAKTLKDHMALLPVKQ